MLLEAYQASFSPPTFLDFFIVKIYKNPPLHILEVHILLSFLSPFWEAAYIIACEV